MEAYFGQTGALQFSKKAGWLISNSTSAQNNTYKEESAFYDKLQYKGLITVKTTRDETNNNITSKDLEIELTDKGRKLLIGETEKYYYLNAFDFDDFQIMNKKQTNDTITFELKIGKITNKTPLYDLIDNKFKDKINNNLNKVAKAKLLKTSDGFQILSVME
jgi:formylmethanofuran dehydrogenase subunit E-like metal-binding protein